MLLFVRDVFIAGSLYEIMNFVEDVNKRLNEINLLNKNKCRSLSAVVFLFICARAAEL